MAYDFSAFIPEIWAQELLINFYDEAVAVHGCNIAYAAAISGVGNKVHIPSLDAVTIGDYTKATDIDIQLLTPTKQTLTINRQKYFAFKFDTIDEFQSAIKDLPGKYRLEAGQGMGETIDAIVLAHYADVSAGNSLDQEDFGGSQGTAITLSTLKTSSYFVGKVLAKMARKLVEAKVPRKLWKLFLPPIFVEALVTSDLVVGTIPTDISTEGLRESWITRLHGFDLFSTNQCAVASDVVYPLGFHPSFMAYAGQFTTVTVHEIEKQFGVLVKGLKVFGEQVTKAAAGVTAKIDSTQIVST